MKPIRLIVEEVNNGRPTTLSTKKYGKYKKQNPVTVPIEFNWVNATLRTLTGFGHDSNIDKFVSIKNIIKNGLDPQYDYYYYHDLPHSFSFFHNLQLTDIYELEVDTLTFLRDKKIPIILDGSMENTDIRTIKGILHKLIKSYELVHGQNFLFLTGNYDRDYIDHYDCTLDNSIRLFPTNYFFNFSLQRFKKQEQENLPLLINSLDNKRIVPDNLWAAFCHAPRISRLLFQLAAEYYNLTDFGKYSRLRSGKSHYSLAYQTYNLSQFNLPYISDDSGDMLDSIILIDQLNENNFPNFFTIEKTADHYLFRVVLEHMSVHCLDDLLDTSTMLTEKTSSAIVMHTPLITLGGQHIKFMLKYYNFIEYPGLEISNESCYFDELNEVIEKMLRICSLNQDQLTKTSQEWLEIAKINYKNYKNINIWEEFTRALRGENLPKI